MTPAMNTLNDRTTTTAAGSDSPPEGAPAIRTLQRRRLIAAVLWRLPLCAAGAVGLELAAKFDTMASATRPQPTPNPGHAP